MIAFTIISVVIVLSFCLWIFFVEGNAINTNVLAVWGMLLVFTAFVGLLEYEYFKLKNECIITEVVENV